MKHKALILLAMGLGIVLAAASVTQAQDSGTSHRLSLADALSLGLENNLGLVSARKDPAIAEQQVEMSKAAFDGVLGATPGFTRVDGDSTITTFDPGQKEPSVVDGLDERDTLSADVSFSQELGYGGRYSVSYSYNDVEGSNTSFDRNLNIPFETAFEFDSTGLELYYEMDLLDGFGTEVNKIDILLAKGNLNVSKKELRRQAIETMQSIENAYWDVVAAREALRISRLALKRAEDLLELNRKKVEVGTLAPIQITEAEAGVAAQVGEVIEWEANLESAEDVLLQWIAVPIDSSIWEQSLELTDRPSFDRVTVDLDEAIRTALENRAEMAMANQQLRDDELSERVARKNSAHGLRLSARLLPTQPYDQVSEGRILAPGSQPSQTFEDGDSTEWQVGLNYTYSIGGRAAKANYKVAQLNKEKSSLSLRNTELGIRVEVRAAARDLHSGHQRIAAARENVRLQTEKLDAEERKFENGMSTSFQVLEFQNDLADAELGLVRAGLDYAKALTALEQAQGTLLEARGLSLGE